MGQLLHEAKGVNGQLQVYADKVVISRRGFVSLISHGLKGDKEIRISQISSIQFKRAGLVNGYIQIAFLGGHEAKGGIWQATHDENTIMFDVWQQETFEKAKALIEERIAALSQPTTAAADDVPTQIRKLADLKAAGILTEEEFEKKAELLARM